MSLLERFHDAEATFLAILSDPPALQAFGDKWATLCSAFEEAKLQSTISDDEISAIFAVIYRVALLGDSIADLEDETNRLTASFHDEIQSVLAGLSVDDIDEDHIPTQQGQGHGGGGPDRPQFDQDEVVNKAAQEGSGDRSLFSSALDFLNNNHDEHNRPVDEEHVTAAHQQAYSNGNASSLSASSMGSAAAMQVLKSSTGGGGSQTQLISLAMAEASKLFDGAGGASSGNKQDAVNSAAMTVMKLLVQSKFSGTTGGGNSGGPGSLIGMVR
ncbi:hypothetical protein BDW22DRAFT_1349847 [Trametopsis cervina]|nr:hypothetical protein BDW22DRAFT_1349847 [Trametopsis cervina]